MDQSLFYRSPPTSEKTNFIDEIRQTFLDLQTNPQEDEIQENLLNHTKNSKKELQKNEINDFLSQVQKYLDLDEQNNALEEILSSISLCFSLYPRNSLPFLDQFLLKNNHNPFFIIIIASVLSELTYPLSELTNQQCNHLIDSCLREIQPQIQNANNNKLTLIDLPISPQFQNNFIINLLLSSNLTIKIFTDFFPYVLAHNLFLNNPKFDLLLEKCAKKDLIFISTQNDETNNQLVEIIKHKDIKAICFFDMNQETLAYISSVVYIIRNKGENEVKNLTSNEILPFFALIAIYIYQNQSDNKYTMPKISDLFLIGVDLITDDSSPLFKLSLNYILNSMEFLFQKQVITCEKYIKVVLSLTKKLISNEYSEDKMLILSHLFDLSSLPKTLMEKFLFKKGKRLLKFIIQNFSEIGSLKSHSLNLSHLNPKDISSYICKTKFVPETLYFMKYFCYNGPKMASFIEIMNPLSATMNEKIRENKWDDVILIGDFLKQNEFTFELNELRKIDFPLTVKYRLFGVKPNEVNSIDELLSFILIDPNPEKNVQLFQSLFNEMIKDKDIRQGYLEYLICIHSYNYNLTTVILKKHLKEYELFKDEFINVINQNFFFDRNINILFKRKNYIPHYLTNYELGFSVISKLFSSINEKPGNYQAFVCLKNISSSFPFLFEKNPQQVFEAVLPSFDYFYLIFENDKIDTQIVLIKTAISAFSFILATLQSPFVFDNFFKWLFTNITSFSESQILAFILLLFIFKDVSIAVIMQVWILKFNFVETVGKLLQRNLNEGLFKSQYINTLCFFISETYMIWLRFTRFEIIQINELMKTEFPLTYFYENIYMSQPCSANLFTLNLKRISNEIGHFKYAIDTPKEFWLSFDFQHKRNEIPNSYQMNSFISKMKKDGTRIENPKNLPKYKDVFTIKMIRYLVMKPSCIYVWFLFGQTMTLFPEFREMISNTINDLKEMKRQAIDNPEDEENRDFCLFNRADFFIPQLKYLVELISTPSISSHYLPLFSKVFKKISKIASANAHFINFTFQKFKEISNGRNGSQSYELLYSMHHIMDLFKTLSSIEEFKVVIDEFFRVNILNVALLPKWRGDVDFLLKVLPSMLIFNSEFPFRISQVFEFIILQKPEKLFALFDIYDKLNKEQKDKIDRLILNNFDQEASKNVMNQNIINYYNKFASLMMKREQKLILLLSKNVEYFTNNNKDKESFDFLINALNRISPKRNKKPSDITEIINQTSSTIPSYIRDQSPLFWNLYEKYSKLIISIISEKPKKLKKFKFLLEFPELINFNIRSSYFRNKMKKRIVKEQIKFKIDRDDILESSFRVIHNIKPGDLLKQITIQYEKEIGIDFGGPLRDWFTKLAHEIFNPNCVLFTCSEKNKSYQPNSQSSINSNHLQYFKFAGLIVARALIEGVCVDAHLTTSFCKQILHSEPNLIDLEDVDSDLYNSLQSLLDSDVDSLCLTFTSNDNEFGVCKTVPLKENGEFIDVINENKNEYIQLLANYKLKVSIEEQVKAFCEGFDSLILNQDIKIFTPNELDLLICGMPTIDVKDFREHTEFIHPYTAETPVVKFFFDAISKWNNERLAKLLLFMTGSSRVPANGFKGFCEMSGQSMKIAAGGDRCLLPVARTCFNRIDLPLYESEDELNEKLTIAIKNCDSFEIR